VIDPHELGGLMASSAGRPGPRAWVLGSVLTVAVLSAALLIVPPLIAQPAGPATAERGTQLGRADGPPSFDDVLRLRDELHAAAVDNPDYPVDEALLSSVATAPQGYTPLGRISIAGIGLDVPFAAGVHPPVLERGPGHWPGTALPGQPGNAVLSGHRTTYTRPFGDLDRLAPGDPIAIATGGTATTVTYRVTDTTIVPEAEYAEFVLRQPADPRVRQLTLFACHPKGDRTHRVVVRAQAADGGS
jgi:sortase A